MSSIPLQECAAFAKEALQTVEEIEIFTKQCRTHLQEWKKTAQKATDTFKAWQSYKLSAYLHHIVLSNAIIAEKEKRPLAGKWIALENDCQTLEEACQSITAHLAKASIALTALQEFKHSSSASDVDDDSSDDEKGLPAVNDLTSPSSNSQDSSARSSTPPSEPEEA